MGQWANPAGGMRWNAIDDAVVQRLARYREVVHDALWADGYPPMTDPVDSPREEYQRLVSLRNANSPLYWEDASAVQRLAQLAERFGPPPAPATPPLPLPTQQPAQPFPAGGP